MQSIIKASFKVSSYILSLRLYKPIIARIALRVHF